MELDELRLAGDPGPADRAGSELPGWLRTISLIRIALGIVHSGPSACRGSRPIETAVTAMKPATSSPNAGSIHHQPKWVDSSKGGDNADIDQKVAAVMRRIGLDGDRTGLPHDIALERDQGAGHDDRSTMTPTPRPAFGDRFQVK